MLQSVLIGWHSDQLLNGRKRKGKKSFPFTSIPISSLWRRPEGHLSRSLLVLSNLGPKVAAQTAQCLFRIKLTEPKCKFPEVSCRGTALESSTRLPEICAWLLVTTDSGSAASDSDRDRGGHYHIESVTFALADSGSPSHCLKVERDFKVPAFRWLGLKLSWARPSTWHQQIDLWLFLIIP